METVYVAIRPGSEYFLEEMAKIFEIAIFTASVPKVRIILLL